MLFKACNNNWTFKSMKKYRHLSVLLYLRYKMPPNFHSPLPNAAILLHYHKYPGLHDTRTSIRDVTIRISTVSDEAPPPSHKSYGQLGAAPLIQPCLDDWVVGWNRGPGMALLICFMVFELYKMGTPHAPGDIDNYAFSAA